jgi:hypothetical protein
LKDAELVDEDRLVFVNACFDVPAREVAAIGARERSGAKSSDRGSLPIAIVHQTALQLRLQMSRILERRSERP